MDVSSSLPRVIEWESFKVGIVVAIAVMCGGISAIGFRTLGGSRRGSRAQYGSLFVNELSGLLINSDRSDDK